MKIISTFPSQDWSAVMRITAQIGETSEEGTVTEPLVCWAIILEQGDNHIVGMISTEGKVICAESYEGFTGYLHISENVDDKYPFFPDEPPEE